MLTVLHGVAISHPRVRCMSSIDDIQHLRCRESGKVEQMEAAETYSKQKAMEAALQSTRGNPSGHRRLTKHGKEILKSLSLSCWNLFLEECKLFSGNKGMCLLFMFEPFHYLHLGILKLVKECTIAYLSSDSLKKNPDMLESETIC